MKPQATEQPPAKAGQSFVVDCTPSWRTQAEWCLIGLDGGSEQTKEIARAEVRRMGQLIDQLLAHLAKQER